MTLAGHAQVFADALLGDHGEMLRGLMVTVTSLPAASSPGPRTRWMPAEADRLASAVTDLAAASDIAGVYVGVGLTRGARAVDPATGQHYKRLSGPDVDGLAWLWVDIDIAGEAHGYSKPLPADVETATRIALSTGLEPTVLVNTGHGVQAHWRLAEPWIYGCVDYDDDGVPIVDGLKVAADRKAGEQLAWDWVTSLRVRAQRDGGWYVDPATDTARLVRCPGSWNRKIKGDHREVRVLDVDASRRYDLDEIRAVLAPETLLASYRYDSIDLRGELAGVDLPALWAAAKSYPQHEPPWLADAIGSGWAPELADLWSGAVDGRYPSDSEVDMALIAAVMWDGFGAARAAEAVMCRRLRIGRKLEKVDPSRRASYLETTVGKVAARLRKQKSEAVSHAESIAASSIPIEDSPVEVQAGQDSGDNSEQDLPEVGGDAEAPHDDDAPPGAGGDADVVPLRPETGESDPEVEHAAAPVAPRQGLEGPIPAKLPPELWPAAAQLAAQLGLPAGVSIWTVGIRYLSGKEELRLWLHRTAQSRVHGGRWRVGEVAGTHWHPKHMWSTRPKVIELLFEDLHLVADVAREWRSDPNGRRMMYELAQEMRRGTPGEVAEMVMCGLIRKATGTALFATAVATRDPWVAGGRIWVPMVAIRDEWRRHGHKVPDAVEMVDLLGGMRCHVEWGMNVAEGHRVVVDEAQWVRVSDSLIPAELAVQAVERAADRDAQDRRAEIRAVNP